MVQNHVLSNVSCCVGRNENLTCSSESPWNEDTKIGFGLISSSNTSREKQKNVFTKKAWIHWCVANCKLFYRTKNVLKIWSLKDAKVQWPKEKRDLRSVILVSMHASNQPPNSSNEAVWWVRFRAAASVGRGCHWRTAWCRLVARRSL